MQFPEMPGMRRHVGQLLAPIRELDDERLGTAPQCQVLRFAPAVIASAKRKTCPANPECDPSQLAIGSRAALREEV